MLLNSLKSVCVKFKRDENGATAIEYGLIAGLIAVVIIAAVMGVGTNLKTKFEYIQGCLSSGGCASTSTSTSTSSGG